MLGYEYRSDSPDEDLVDPRGRGPSFCFQPMDAPRPQRNRVHIDVWVPHDQAEARVAAVLAAGGRLVSDEHAPEWWTLADAEGNEVGADGVVDQQCAHTSWRTRQGPCLLRSATPSRAGGSSARPGRSSAPTAADTAPAARPRAPLGSAAVVISR